MHCRLFSGRIFCKTKFFCYCVLFPDSIDLMFSKSQFFKKPSKSQIENFGKNCSFWRTATESSKKFLIQEISNKFTDKVCSNITCKQLWFSFWGNENVFKSVFFVWETLFFNRTLYPILLNVLLTTKNTLTFNVFKTLNTLKNGRLSLINPYSKHIPYSM